MSINRLLNYLRWHRTHWVKLDDQSRAPLFELLALLHPQKAQGMEKIRVGSNGDGGYVMLNDLEEIDLALSLGIGPDVSWDYDLAEKGIPVLQFDHTIARPPREHPLFHFERKRIATDNSVTENVTLASILQKQAGKQLLLKMDIEGDEWDVLFHTDLNLLGNCRQIVLELHDFLSIGDLSWRSKARQALHLLARNFGVVHVHGNNLSKHILLKGHCLPDSLEVTFANRAFYQLQPTEETFPTRLDRKNNVYFPDFRLGRFQF